MLLFLTDGQPNDPWGEAEYAKVAKDAKALDVHVMTYALGAGADSSVTKRLACESQGISHVIDDTSGDKLANAMASYFKLLSPMLSPCQTRWVNYTDSLTGTELLGACMAAYQKVSGSSSTSCQGGLDGLGEVGDARTPALLGVACIDMNLIVDLNTVRARPDWPTFDAVTAPILLQPPTRTAVSASPRCTRSRPPVSVQRVKSERTACPRVTLTEPQLETLRKDVSAAAVCSSTVGGTTDGGGNSTDGGEDAINAGAAVGGAFGGVVLLCALAGLVGYFVSRRKTKIARAPVPGRGQRGASAAHPQGNVHVVQGVMMGTAVA